MKKWKLCVLGESPNNDTRARSHYIWRNRQQKRRNELIPYNDCLYRHINTHDWVLIVDTDELVVPIKHDNWSSMLDDIVDQFSALNRTSTLNRCSAATETVNGQDVLTSLSVINAFKFDNLTTTFNQSIADYMHMLRHR